jgi:hypothetical protein
VSQEGPIGGIEVCKEKSNGSSGELLQEMRRLDNDMGLLEEEMREKIKAP